jgi:dolichol-phosphate mannosyltransferase
MKIVCIIPSYKEKGNLEELTLRLASVLNKLHLEYNILYVIQTNDGSIKLLNRLKNKIPELKYIYFEKPLGIGLAYKKGFEKTEKKFSHILTLDGDLNHNPSDIPFFIKALLQKNADIIIGSRYIKGGQFNDKRIWKKIISYLTNRLLTLIIKIKVRDISSGFRLMKREVIDTVYSKLQESGYPSYMELILRAKSEGFKIYEIPITYTPRKWGKSKMSIFKTFTDYLLFLPKVLFTF